MSLSSHIILRDVSFRYPGPALSGVQRISLSIGGGSVVAIIGESGSGKSTLLKLVYGLVSPEEGQVFFGDERIIGPEEKLIPGHDRMKMVTQDFNLNTYAKVYDNIASMLPNTDLKRKESETVAMMELLRLSHLSKKRVADLSGGEQQRVAIARAMITRPEVLLLDEPFSQVDTLLKSQLRNDIRRLNREHGTSIILVSHDPVDGLSMADKLVILRKGELVEEGDPAVLFEQPRQPYTAQLLAESMILEADEALRLGIDSGGRQVGIHPEWIVLTAEDGAHECRLIDTLFRGSLTDHIVESNGVKLVSRSLSGTIDASAVRALLIRKWVSF